MLVPRPHHRRRRQRAVIRTALAGAGIVTMAAAGWLTIVDGDVAVSDGSADAAPPTDGRDSGTASDAPTSNAGTGADGAATGGPSPTPAAGTGASRQTAKAAGTREGTRAANHRALKVESGDTMITLLQDAGVSGGEAFKAVTALKEVYEPRKLRPGQEVRVALDAAESDGADSGAATKRLAGLRLRASAERDVAVERTPDGGFTARDLPRDLTRGVARVTGTIESSLMRAADRRDVPMEPLLTVIKGFSYAVDFQRDLREGNGFEVVWERYRDSTGEVAKLGEVLYAALETRDERLAMYRFERDNGHVDYFNADGESVRRLLMRTPINGARLSSGYGMREHPILGYSRMHEGLDFAAPRGTPVYAAGQGRIEAAGWKGGYGRYIRIDHTQGYTTAYGHLKGYADGIADGAWVSQGDVIGYVGNSGRSTGPHLHYEIRKGGQPVNPRDLDLPTGYQLKGEELARFQDVKARIDRQREQAGDTKVAQAACDGEDAGADC
jgi:murein DD-endopeptidase MepM/ murein hydrolase activator NlpD